MSLFATLRAIKDIHLTPGAPKPLRTKTPLRLSQDSAVTISIAPLIIAEEAGSLFKSDLSLDHKVFAVGRFSLFDLAIYRVYLSQGDGAFLQISAKDDKILEILLYRPYDELYPSSSEDWAFWLADADGYIGLPVMQSKDVDGSIAFRRKLGGDHRVAPIQVIEIVTGITGGTTSFRHRMMWYTRDLTDPALHEHLLVAAVEGDTGASVNLWLGLDLAAADLRVFAAADAPL